MAIKREGNGAVIQIFPKDIQIRTNLEKKRNSNQEIHQIRTKTLSGCQILPCIHKAKPLMIGWHAI
jgi:hypothetical protein